MSATVGFFLSWLALGCRTPICPYYGTTDDTGVAGPPIINELMAANRATVANSTGAYADWIELYNPGGLALALDGWTISDDFDEPDKHRLEQLVVEPGDYLLLWADGDPGLGPSHLDFRLDAQGEELGLYAPDGEPISGLSFGKQAADHSLARSLDGSSTWVFEGTPTPGESNGAAAELDDGPWPAPPAPCELNADLASPYLLEGDLVDTELTCDGSLGTEQAQLEPVSLPEGATWADGSFTWPTGPADGGRIELVFALTTAGIVGETPSAETITFWVADDPSAEDNVPVDPYAYTEEWGLPVFHVTPWSEVGNGYVAAELVYRGSHYSCFFKIRGATSSYYPKPGYMLEFDEQELAIELWGTSRDHLALITPFDDNAYVRQKLIYDQWAAIAEFWGEERLTPRSYFAVLYLSGTYRGLFMALDRVDNEFLDQQGFDRDSNLYKAVEHDANFFLTDASGEPKKSLHQGYEKEEGLPEDDFSDLEALVSFTGHAEAQELVDGIGAWLDPGEFMDWFLLVHYSLSDDSAGKNCYLATAPEERYFRYVPWDFNYSWGQDWRTRRTSSSTLTDYSGFNKIFWAIQELETSEAELWERYRSMAQPGGPFEPDWIRAQLDAYYALIEPSAQRDWDMWGQDYQSYESWAEYRDEEGDWTDYQGEKAYLYQWLDERAAVYEKLR